MELKIGKYTVAITNPERILFPKDAITKLDLINYYHDIAPVMFPYLKNRLIVMLRYPAGITKEGFFHKDAPDYFPSWIKRKSVAKEEGGSVHYVVGANKATMPYLANFGCITPHTWLSRIDELHKPDTMIFDLDPDKASFAMVQKVALLLRDFLINLKLVPFVKTTGQHGLHVVVPIKRLYDFDTVRACARTIAQELVNQYPKLLTLEMRKEKRGDKIFVDFLRNAFGQTAVAPYGVRPHEHAPVAAPIDWNEAEDKKLFSARYTMKTIFKRLEKKGDPWEGYAKAGKSLTTALKLVE
ncbi:MAG: non-homologous end-joining DNA ligase [Candidatus Dependentiae bacterium]|nr:non-homologous end-joining DNA ligase [Candidatus Dependentiae bacterium]